MQFLKALRVSGYDMASAAGNALESIWKAPVQTVTAEPAPTTVSLTNLPSTTNTWFTPSGGDMIIKNRSNWYITITGTNGQTSYQYPLAPNGTAFLPSDVTLITSVVGGNPWDTMAPAPMSTDFVTLDFVGSQGLVAQGTPLVPSTSTTGTSNPTTGGSTSTGQSTTTGTPTSTTTGTSTTGSNPASGSTGGTGAGTATGTTYTYYPIYVNGVQNSWRDYSYGSTFVTSADTRVTNGVQETATTGLAQYKAFNFNANNSNPVAISGYLGVTIDAYCEVGNPTLRFQLDSGDNGNPLTYLDITLTNNWATYKYLFTDTGVTNNSISTSSFTNVELLNLQTTTTGKVHINNVQLIINPNPSAPTYSLVPIDSAPATDYGSALALHVKGPHFYDANNNVWVGRGMNVCDTRMAGKAREVDGNTPTVTAQEWMRRVGWAMDQGVDFFRLYLDQQSASLDLVNNANYLQSIKMVVNYVGSRGGHIMITCGVDYTCFPFLPTSGQPTVASFTHWSQIATSFRNSPHVLFGFCNEPQNNDTTATQAAYMATVNSLIGVIRQVEARDSANYPHICVIQGPTHYARHGLFFNTTRAVDPTYPITDLVNTVGYLAYEVHNYESQANWGAVPYNEGLPGQSVAIPTFPFLLGEFGFNYYAQSDGSATVTSLTSSSDAIRTQQADDMTPFFVACETYKVPYCIWILDFRDPPALMIDNDPYGYGLNKPLQWTDVGVKFINLLRSYKGLSGTVDLNGQPVTSGTVGTPAQNGSGNGGVAAGSGTGSNTGGTGGSTGSGSGTGGGGSTQQYYWVWQNGVQNSFTDNSYTGTYSTASDTRVTSGLAKTGLIQQYGAMNFTINTALSATAYHGITVDLYAATGNPQIRIQIDTNSSGSPIIYELKTLTNTWTTYTFLWTDASAVGTAAGTFTNLEIINLSSTTTPKIYMNNLGMIV